MNNRIIHTCHCLKRDFTAKEWQEFDHRPNKVVHTFNGYKYNINDVCLNPTKLDLSQGKYMLIIKYCQSDCGKWSAGIDYLLGNSGASFGCSFLPCLEEGHSSREKAIYAALKYAKNEIETKIDRIKNDYVYDDNGNKVQFGKYHIPHLRKILSSVQKKTTRVSRNTTNTILTT